ncbi:MAG TPA: hypothetical protein VFW71_09300 [Actinomycetota bacterium]|nr:hypothetical protein [Actinomycetota bacterium]
MGPGGLFALGLLIILLVAAIPYLVSIKRVVDVIVSIRGHIDGILANGVVLTGELDGVPELLEVTDSVVKEVAVGATRYANGLDRVVRGA